MTADAQHSVATAIEGYYLAMAMDVLHREGALAALLAGEALPSIAQRLGLDLRALEGVVALVATRSDLLERSAEGEVGPGAGAAPNVPALLDLYVGAFGPCLAALSSTLRSPAGGARWLDEERHAAAFSGREGSVPPLYVALIRELGIGTLLELGCASGSLLFALAEDAAFRGVGIDVNARAISVGRARAQRSGFGQRLEFVQGEALEAAASLSAARREEVDALFASSLFNGYFGWGGTTIEQALSRLGELFPNRILILADYYGNLGTWLTPGHGPGVGWVHDFAQLVSGQGVPPPDLAAWQAIYAATGTTFVRSLERVVDGVRTFVHIVQLPGPG